MTKIKASNNKTITVIEDPEIKAFLNIQKPRTAQTYGTCFRKLFEWDSTITGKKMLEEKEIWERGRLIEFRTYLEKEGFSQNFSACAQGAIRGFFANARKPLLLTRTEKKRLGERSNSTEDYVFDKVSLKTLWDIADLEGKYILSNKSMGLRGNDYLKITWKDLRSVDLSQEAPIFFKVVQTEKERVPAYVFWDNEVIEVVRAMLESHKNAKDDERVLTFREEHLSYIMRGLAQKAQIQNGNKRIHFHTLRKFLYDRLVSVSSVDKAKSIIGKKVSSSDSTYMNPQNLREIFVRVVPDITFNGNGIKKKVEALSTTTEQLVKMLGEKDKEIQDLKADKEKESETLTAILSNLIGKEGMIKAIEEYQKKHENPDVTYGIEFSNWRNEPKELLRRYAETLKR